MRLYKQVIGDTLEASKLYKEVIDKATDPAAQIEARIMLANILNASDKEDDKAKAKSYYRAVLSMAEQQLQANATLTAARLWMAMASPTEPVT